MSLPAGRQEEKRFIYNNFLISSTPEVEELGGKFFNKADDLAAGCSRGLCLRDDLEIASGHGSRAGAKVWRGRASDFKSKISRWEILRSARSTALSQAKLTKTKNFMTKTL